MGGLLLSLLPLALDAVGLASLNVSPWRLLAAIAGPLVLLSVASASVSLMLARGREARELAEPGEDPAEIGLTGGEAKELLGGPDPSLHGHPAASRRDRVRVDAANRPGDA